MSTLNLTARQPFNFLSVVNSHGWVELAPFVFDETGKTLLYTDQLSNHRVVEYRISESPQGVKVETTGKLGKSEQRETAEKVTWMLGLDMDFSAFYKAARREPKLRAAEKLARGRVLRSPTFFEDVVKTILTTNTLWAATIRMNGNLITTFGESLSLTPSGVGRPERMLSDPELAEGETKQKSKDSHEVEGSRAFPTPERIAASRPQVLRETVRVGYRAPAIHELATRVASGELDLESFKTSSLPTLELRQELLKIKGVGPYAAANLLMLLGRHDFIPIDSWALRVVSHEWYRGRPVTAKVVERRFAEWGEFKGLAYWFWDWKHKYNGG